MSTNIGAPIEHGTVAGLINELAERESLPDSTIDSTTLRVQFLQNFRLSSKRFGEARTHLGKLDAFPMEILQRALSEVDVRTLYNSRRVNRRALHAVHAIPNFSWVVAAAPDVLRAIIGTKFKNGPSLNVLYDTIRSPKCSSCDDFGPLIYLLTCARVCLRCLGSTMIMDPRKPLYTPVPYDDLCRDMGLSASTKATLPRLFALPGVYGELQRAKIASLWLVDYGTALREGGTTFGRPRRIWPGPLSSQSKSQKSSWSRAFEEPDPTPQALHVQSARAQRRAQWRRRCYEGEGVRLTSLMLQPYRYMVTVAAPWLVLERNGSLRQLVRAGWACKACENMSIGPQNWRRRYMEEGLVKHIVEECDESRAKIKNLLKANEG